MKNDQITECEELISALRIDLYECHEHPSNHLRPYRTEAIIKSSWVSQTIADQVWVLFLFRTIEERLNWEKSLQPPVSQWLNREIIPYGREFGWRSWGFLEWIFLS